MESGDEDDMKEQKDTTQIIKATRDLLNFSIYITGFVTTQKSVKMKPKHFFL